MGNISSRVDVGDQVAVGADLYAPSRQEDIPADIAAVLVLDGRRYVVEELRITRQDDGPPITSELIRKIPVHAIIRSTASLAVELRPARAFDGRPDLQLAVLRAGIEDMIVRTVEDLALSPDDRKRLVAAGPTDETLLWVARVYILAELAGDPPAKVVRETFGVPTSTAGYWIRRAKDRKILNG
jgi:hypothetical protein